MPPATVFPMAAQHFENHEYQSVRSEDLEPDVAPHENVDMPTPDLKDLPMQWRPFYLRRTVLLGFISVFVSIAVAIESLLAVSNRDHGLATSTSSVHYLWTYGPTAFLTGLAALWARTEYQSQIIVPWNRLSQKMAPASDSLLLNYIFQSLPFAILNSLRKRDFIVSIARIVSIILKIVITLSTGLISLSLTTVTHNSYPMVVQNKFVNSNARLTTAGDLASYMMQGLVSQNLTLPNGMSRDYAFQSVETKLSNIIETRVTVDGLINWLDCLPVELHLAEADTSDPYTIFNSLNLTISSPACNVRLVSLPGIIVSGTPGNGSTLFSRFQQIQCDGASGDIGKRVLVMVGNMAHFTDYSQNITTYIGTLTSPIFTTLRKSTQLLCEPGFIINRVEVVRNGTQTKSVLPVPGAPNRTIESVTAWNIMEAQFEAGFKSYAFINPISGTRLLNVSMVSVDVDDSMKLALDYQFASESQTIDFFDLFDPDVLYQTAAGYYQQISAIIAEQSLLVSEPVNTIGSATLSENRLIVSPGIAHGMAGLVTAAALLTAIALFMVPTSRLIPRSSAGFINLASLFRHSRGLVTQLRYAGASDNEHLAEFLKPSTFRSEFGYDYFSNRAQFYVIGRESKNDSRPNILPQISSKIVRPLALHPAFRLILCLGITGLIITLELLLQKSTSEHGLGGIDNNAYIHYTWTAIPALVFGALAMAFSAIDFQTRAFTPYIALKGHVPSHAFTQLEFLDMIIPLAMHRQIKLRMFWSLATTTAFLVASLFTTFSSSLFQESIIPFKSSLVLHANQSFMLKNPSQASNTHEISSLILESNYSFPRFTYNNLAFPELVPTTPFSSSSAPNVSAVSISAVIPAIRERMDCRSYDYAQIHTNLTLNYNDFEEGNPLMVTLDLEGCLMEPIEMQTYANMTYFGQGALVSPLGLTNNCNEGLAYVWGKIDYAASPIVQPIAAVGCEVTLECVDVNATFAGIEFEFDPQNPPKPLESTVRNTTVTDSQSIDVYNDGHLLAQMDVSPQNLDAFFSILVTSRWAVPISALGDPSADAKVIDAIKFQHGIIRAQLLASNLVPANETNATLAAPIELGANDAQPLYNATVSAVGQRRVTQDAASTHILVALMATTLVLFVVGWLASPATNVLPRNPSSIASVLALLAGGNIFDRLPSDTKLESPEDIIEALGGRDTWFWIGWGTLPDEEGRAMGGENEGGVSRFGIFVLNKEEMELARKQNTIEGTKR